MLIKEIKNYVTVDMLLGMFIKDFFSYHPFSLKNVSY